MNFKELLDYIDKADKEIVQKHNDVDIEKRTLRRMAKITEEVGELSNEVLAYNSLQRKNKQNEFSSETLEDEFADVILTTLLLAKSMNVNIISQLKTNLRN